MDLITQLVELVVQLDRQNVHLPPAVALHIRNHGFTPHRSYLRPPPPPPRPRCSAMTRHGSQCINKCAEGLTTCLIHSENPTPRSIPLDAFRCTEMTSNGERCKCSRYKHFSLCWRHAKRAGILPPPPEIPTECAICYTELEENRVVRTACAHYFHEGCFDAWRETRTANFQAVTCPMCRHPRPRPRPQ